MKRVVVDGSQLAGFRPSLPDQWLKVFVPVPEGERPHGRAYTVRWFDPATGKFAIDFVLHGDEGRASAWVARADVGDAFQISAVHPRSGFPIHPDAPHYLFLGDETALPAIGSILEVLPPHVQASAVVEVEDSGEEQELRTDAALTVTWLHRAAQGSGSRRRLDEAARSVDLPHGVKVWVAAESSIVAAIRRHLLLDRGIERSTLRAAGYWKQGEADHRDEEATT
jgi:NADPH-dependent ferric siderophore reductase